MAATTSPTPAAKPSLPSAGPKIALSIAGVAVVAIGWVGGLVAGAIVLLALLGTPLFAVLGGSSELAWFLQHDESKQHLRFIGTKIFNQEFSDSPILVTIPLFTFVGYVLAESKTPDRLVRAARGLLGWLPGGLAIVCIIASAIFTVLTGGSGVTIIAIGGLLYPALRKQGYSEKFSLGLVTTGGSVGLLLPYSLPLMVYALVARVDIQKAFKAVLIPGALVIVLLSLYAAFTGSRDKIPRERVPLPEVGRAVWGLKWEFFIPVLLVLGIGTGLAEIDEAAGLVALYAVVVQVWVHKDLSWKKDIPRIAKASMSLAGAIILILAMANALVNFIVFKDVPSEVLGFLGSVMGIKHMWQFLIAMNIFLLILGMLMEGFSAILVAVPLIIPFVAGLGKTPPYNDAMSPFQLAMIFLLNLEIAYCVPPLGLNLFIASYRFNRPVVQMYRVVLPYVAILTISLIAVSYVPWFSTVLVRSDIHAERAKVTAQEVKMREEKQLGENEHLPIPEAWKLECVQEDTTHALPCTPEEWKEFPNGQRPAKVETAEPGGGTGGETGGGTEPEPIDYDALIKQYGTEGEGGDAGK